MMQQLPIDQVPNTNPPLFKWKYIAETPIGKQVVDQEGVLPPTLEVPMQRMISMVKQLLMENAALQGRIKAMENKVDEVRPTLSAQGVGASTNTGHNKRKG